MFKSTNAIETNVENTGAAVAPAVGESSEKKIKDKRVTLLVLSIVTFIFMSCLPLFTIKQAGNLQLNINLYVNDFSSVAFAGSELANGEGFNLAGMFNESMDESISNEEDEIGKKKMKDMKDDVTPDLEKIETEINTILEKVGDVSTIILAVLFGVLAAFIVSVYAAAKNKLKLYAFANIALFVFFLGLGIAVDKAFGLENIGIGGGLALAMIMFIVNAVVALKKKKVTASL